LPICFYTWGSICGRKKIVGLHIGGLAFKYLSQYSEQANFFKQVKKKEGGSTQGLGRFS